jgi:hypothetical protein
MVGSEGERGGYPEVEEVDDGPRGAGCATEDGEHEEPREEEDEDVGRPHARVHEPLRVLVQIRRRERLHVQLHHRRAPRLFPNRLLASLFPPDPAKPDGTPRHAREEAAASCVGGPLRCGGGIYRGGRAGRIDRCDGGGREGGMELFVQRWGRVRWPKEPRPREE